MLPGGSPVSILVADDEELMREVVALQLNTLGYQVIQAKDGEEALAMAREHHPKLVILDIRMPKVNGWEVAQQLRRDPNTADIKILILSGIGCSVLEATMPVLGGDLGLDKPFKPEELEQAVNLLLADVQAVNQ
jgi:CheY-like chemotaxis protein